MIRLLKYLWICLITENEIVSSGLTDNEREADEGARDDPNNRGLVPELNQKSSSASFAASDSALLEFWKEKSKFNK